MHVTTVVNEHIRLFDLGSVMNVVASTLPASAKRKLTIALATLGQPSVLILDMPTQGRLLCTWC